MLVGDPTPVILGWKPLQTPTLRATIMDELAAWLIELDL